MPLAASRIAGHMEKYLLGLLMVLIQRIKEGLLSWK